MKDYYNLEYTRKDGHKSIVTSESQEYINFIMDNIVRLEENLELDETTNTPEEITGNKNSEEIIKSILSSLSGISLLDTLSMLQVEQQDINTPDSATPPEYSLAALDILALIAMSSDIDTNNKTRNGEIDTGKLRNLLYELIVEANYKSLEFVSLNYNPRNMISQLLKSHEATVRGRQYHSVSREINDFILNHPNIKKIWKANLGFTYEDLLLVREAIHENSSAKFYSVFSDIESIREIMNNFSIANLSEMEKSRVVKHFQNLTQQRPSELHIFTNSEIIERTNLSSETIVKILDIFSIKKLDIDSTDAIIEYINGNNLVRRKSLLSIDDEKWYFYTEGILLDEIIKITESAIKEKYPSAWSKYSTNRDRLVEDLAYSQLHKILGTKSKLYKSFKYRNPGTGNEFDLASDSNQYTKTDFTEADILCIIDGVAFCVEVKAGGIRESSRSGNSLKLITDLEKTIKEASLQSQRLRKLIEINKGVWGEKNIWIDLSHIKEVHQFVICLEDLNSISPTLQSLVDSGVLVEDNVPWVVSISDLMVFTRILQRPHDFLRYIRIRTLPESIKLITAQDELDLLMWFIYGGFHIEIDPRRAYEIDEASPKPSKKDIKIFENQGSTYVHTFTGELDSYMYHDEDPLRYSIKEIKISEQPLDKIINQIQKIGEKGWLRTSATLSRINHDTQNQILKHLESASLEVLATGREKSFSFNVWSHQHNTVFCFFIAPSITQKARLDFQNYLEIKKHWVKAKSAFGVLFDLRLNISSYIYFDNPYIYDKELDREARRRGYVPPEIIPRVKPPSKQRKKRNKKKK